MVRGEVDCMKGYHGDDEDHIVKATGGKREFENYFPYLKDIVTRTGYNENAFTLQVLTPGM